MRLVNYNPYEIQTMRMNGISTRHIAEYYGVKVKTLTSWCSRHKVSLLKLTNFELEEEILSKTVKEIAYEYSMNIQTVYSRLERLGISPKVKRMR